jgi:hypothetical protein
MVKGYSGMKLGIACSVTCVAFTLVSCGGGGSSSATAATPNLTLQSIALTPASLSLAPGATAQVTVTGTYSDGSTKTLPSADESFQSSSTAVATVDATGVVTVPTSAVNAATAMISAMDPASGMTTSAAKSTQVTVAAGNSAAPTASSAAAVSATAQNNAQCTAIQPFYWEIGNGSSALASGSSTQAGGTAVTSATKWPIASASKWIYGMYVVQSRGGVTYLTAADIRFLTFTSGYTYMGSDTQGQTCTAPASGADSINHCLTLPSTTSPGAFFSTQNPNTVGVFDYDSGHEENHAGQFQPEISGLDTTALGAEIATGLNIGGITLRYNQPLLAGGIYASADDYSPILRAVVNAQLGMLNALGTNPVCAWTGASSCNAAFSPNVTQHWHYSIAHWVEDDPTSGDGAFSSPGAFGFYPWIESNKKFYGVISRYAAATGAIQNGLASALCGRELRAAWETGVQQ